jgi:hypothetical protein
VVLDLQRQAETYYLSSRLLAFDVARMRSTPPVLFAKPAPARWFERLIPALARVRARRMIRDSGFFDAVWYLERNPDVRKAGVDPVRHFLHWGAQELRDPGPRFSIAQYLTLYPDVKAAGVNPLVHYLTTGWDEKRVVMPPRRQA